MTRTLAELAVATDRTPEETRRLMRHSSLRWLLGLPDEHLLDDQGNPVPEDQREAYEAKWRTDHGGVNKTLG
jgi:hypothetical protein